MEAILIDRSQKLEEVQPMLGVFHKVLFDHVQCGFEYALKNRGHVGIYSGLLRTLIPLSADKTHIPW